MKIKQALATVISIIAIAGGEVGAVELSFEVVLDGLSNPCGVAVQPTTGHVFVSVSGSGKIVRVLDGQTEDAIVGFPIDSYGKGPTYDVGPLGIMFLDEQHLVVGGGGLPDGEELVRIYKVPEPGEPAIDAASMHKALGPLRAEENRPGEGNFFGVAVGKASIFVTSNGDDQKGWIAKAEFKNPDQISPLKRAIATKEHVGVDAPTAITLNSKGQIVVGQMGEIDQMNDSLLTFYDPASGKLLLTLNAGLHDIVSLIYGSPQEPSKKSHLYALDFAWSQPNDGGLFQLDAQLDNQGRQQVKSTRLVALKHPTAMALGVDKSLLVTLFGTDKESGKLIRFQPGL